MARSALFRSFVVAAAALVIGACSGADVTSPAEPLDNGTGTGSLGSLASKDANGLELRALWWEDRPHNSATASAMIGPAGGVIVIPETGLTVSIPAGALSSFLSITITADPDYVAYRMEPTGTQFLKDVTATQLFSATELASSPLRSQLYVAYIADDSLNLSGKVPVLELEPTATIFSSRSPGVPYAQIWIIRHFSRYMLASG
jgi:hypothetical protein